jgi:eukaryotic-like serine/threonine-protein kinase
LPLAPGSRLGVYDITASIGEGGMGQVFRARDTRLDRLVAIKVLPAAFAHDTDRLARFQREAKTLASLNHPHIAAIYGLEESGGVTALVMELVEGDDLSQRIARGAIPIDEALPIAKQIAEALEAAHEQGIIHRDLKPANIKVRADGTVKVLDFGLAKAMEPVRVASASVSMSPTLTTPAMTQAGMILGTAAYMSPEQARGKTVDKRADIWAFGAVLFEMLTGTRAFAGSDVSDVLASVLAREPDWLRLPATVPASLGTYIRRCLQKDPRQRLHDIADMRLALEGAFEIPVSVPSRGRPMLYGALGVALAVAVLATVTAWSLARSAPTAAPLRPVRLSVALPAFDQLNGLALSPDGGTLVFAARRGNVQLLYRRALDQLEAVPISGSDGGTRPFFSPDGAWIGFETPDALKKLPLAGGEATTLVRGANSLTNGSWGDHDRLVLERFSDGTGLVEVSASGGELKALTTLHSAPGETHHQWPQILPGGTAVLFEVHPAAKIVVESFQTHVRTELADGTYPRYVPTGHIVFVKDTSIWALPFDLTRLAATGPAFPVGADVGAAALDRSYVFAVSDNGTFVYVRNQVVRTRRLAWVDSTGREEAISAEPRLYDSVRLSPDGKRVVMCVGMATTNPEIWVHDLVQETQTQLTFDPGVDAWPIWTRDGQRIVYSSSRAGARNLFWQSADGAGQAERLTSSPLLQSPWTWSRDGASLVLQENDPKTGWDLSVLAMKGDGKAQKLINTPASELSPAISPTGEWMVYSSNESGRAELYVTPFPNVTDGKWRISIPGEGGADAHWSPDGRQIFYLSPGSWRMMAVPVTGGKSFNAGRARMLFQGEYFRNSSMPSYDIAPDGRFLIVKEDPAPRQELVVVLNWPQDLKARAPTK